MVFCPMFRNVLNSDIVQCNDRTKPPLSFTNCLFHSQNVQKCMVLTELHENKAKRKLVRNFEKFNLYWLQR